MKFYKGYILKISHIYNQPCPWRHPVTKDQLLQLLSLSEEKIKNNIIQEWQQMWDNSTGIFYRAINPTVSYKPQFKTNPRAKDVMITRLRLCHVRLKTTLYTIGQAADPNCEICLVPEDINHFLIQCPRQGPLQHQLLQKCRHRQLNFSVETILNDCMDLIYDHLTTNNIRL